METSFNGLTEPAVVLDVFVGRIAPYPLFWNLDLIIDQLAAEKPKEKLPSAHQRWIKYPCKARPREHEAIKAIEDCRLPGKCCKQMHCIGPIVVLPTPENHHAFVEIEVARADIAYDWMLRTRIDQVNTLPTLPQLVQQNVAAAKRAFTVINNPDLVIAMGQFGNPFAFEASRTSLPSASPRHTESTT